MMFSKLKWLIVIQLLLNEQALCRVPPPLAPRNKQLPTIDTNPKGQTNKQDHQALQASKPQLSDPSAEMPGPVSMPAQDENSGQPAKQIISVLRGKLQGQVQNRLHIQENISCEEMLSASTVDDSLSSIFPQELLGLSLVPVLVVAGCPNEAQALVQRLYGLLGVTDTNELLMEVESLIEMKLLKAAATTVSPSEREEAGQHIEAVMFNIQRLAGVREQNERCEGWIRMNGTTLVGTPVEGATGSLEKAVSSCEKLGVLCAGVTHSRFLKPGFYQAVLKKGSRILPTEFTETDCWILQCSREDHVSASAVSGHRIKRSPQRSCIDKREERIYNVMEWIPAVSTLYNLGTAVYYASVNCSETAKERAILSAVDLGTDALMVVTGGTAGVAGYAVGAGVKTGVKAGVKYLLNSMKQEDDVLVNQSSWEDGVITIQ